MEKLVDAMSEKQFIRVNRVTAPVFIDPNELTIEMKDPDYRLNLLKSRYPGMNSNNCSRCHHCR
jgi:hypothetical protein